MSFLYSILQKIFGIGGDTGKLSWTEVIVLGIIPAGQLYARIFNFKGSLDKWWLMFPIALFPPISFLTLVLMKFGYINDGNGSDPVDKMILLPIIAKFFIPFIMPYLIDVDDTILTLIVSFIFKLLLVMTCNLYRRYDNCKDITFNSIGKAGIDSVISTSVGDVLPIALSYIPIVGFVYSVMSIVPIIGDKNIIDSIFWSIGFGATYILINMFNQNDMGKYCSTPFTGNLEDKVPFITAIGVLIGAHTFDNFMGGNIENNDD